MSATTPATLPATSTWNIDGVHSTVNISVKHNVVATFRATFLGVSGSLDNGELSGSVPVDGLQLGLPMFKEHLLSEGFLDAAKHPTLNFRSSDVTAQADGNLVVNGELTIRGVTKPIIAAGTVTGPVEVARPDNSTGDVLGLALTTKIDRRDFGLEIAAGTGWDVTIEVNLELTRA